MTFLSHVTRPASLNKLNHLLKERHIIKICLRYVNDRLTNEFFCFKIKTNEKFVILKIKINDINIFFFYKFMIIYINK